jgi:predicted membrane channel-forming protein YqfA (hemolysin III family)
VSILTLLTLAAVAVVVLVLVVYLVGIAYYLWRADRHLAKLVGGLQAIQGHARPLPEHLTTINGALKALRDDLGGTRRHLEGVGRVLERD